MKILKPLLLVLSTLIILFCGTMMLTQSSCITTPKVSTPVVKLDNKVGRAFEKETIINLVITINEKIPPETVVLKSDINRVVKLIQDLIEDAGYNKTEYTFKWWICDENNFRIYVEITPKYWTETIFKFDGIYQYNDNDV